MKRTLVRTAGLLLTLALCAGLLTALAPAASAVSLKEKQEAIIRTAFAYFDKGAPVQYDSMGLSVVSKGKGGAIRSTHETAPEYATPDETMYSVCSDFTYQVYYDVFGYRVCGDAVTNCCAAMSKFDPEKDPICAYIYNGHKDNTPVAEALAKYMSMLQPGDIINTSGDIGSGGHAMLYIGDYFGDGNQYALHCGGSKYNTLLGEDIIECTPGMVEAVPGKINLSASKERNNGAILLSVAVQHLLDYYAASPRVFSVIRPLNVITDEEYPMKPAARGRLQFPRLVYNRTASPYTRFNDVEEGGAVTLKVELKNCSKEAYTVPVKEVVPDGLSVVKASDGAKVDGRNISWDVALGAGETKTVSYDCTVTAKRGSTITFAGGSAGTIPSNTLRIPVGGKHLTDAENAILADIPNGAYKPLYKGVTKEAFVPIVWQKILKMNVKLPTMRELVQNMLKKTEFGGKTVYVVRDDLEGEWKTCRDMLVPEFAGGFYYGEMDSLRRVLDLRCDYLQPGDVVYEIKSVKSPDKGQVMVYLGNGQFLRQVRTDGGAAVLDWFELQRAHCYDLFFALRPTLAYDDVHTLS